MGWQALLDHPTPYEYDCDIQTMKNGDTCQVHFDNPGGWEYVPQGYAAGIRAAKTDDEFTTTKADATTTKPHHHLLLGRPSTTIPLNTVYNNDDVISPTINGPAAKGVKLTSFYTYRYCSPTRSVSSSNFRVCAALAHSPPVYVLRQLRCVREPGDSGIALILVGGRPQGVVPDWPPSIQAAKHPAEPTQHGKP